MKSMTMGPARLAQPDLARHDARRVEIEREDRQRRVAPAARGAAAVDVDHGRSRGVGDDERAAARQRDAWLQRGGDVAGDAVILEERRCAAMEREALGERRRDCAVHRRASPKRRGIVDDDGVGHSRGKFRQHTGDGHRRRLEQRRRRCRAPCCSRSPQSAGGAHRDRRQARPLLRRRLARARAIPRPAAPAPRARPLHRRDRRATAHRRRCRGAPASARESGRRDGGGGSRPPPCRRALPSALAPAPLPFVSAARAPLGASSALRKAGRSRPISTSAAGSSGFSATTRPRKTWPGSALAASRQMRKAVSASPSTSAAQTSPGDT